MEASLVGIVQPLLPSSSVFAELVVDCCRQHGVRSASIPRLAAIAVGSASAPCCAHCPRLWQAKAPTDFPPVLSLGVPALSPPAGAGAEASALDRALDAEAASAAAESEAVHGALRRLRQAGAEVLCVPLPLGELRLPGALLAEPRSGAGAKLFSLVDGAVDRLFLSDLSRPEPPAATPPAAAEPQIPARTPQPAGAAPTARADTQLGSPWAAGAEVWLELEGLFGSSDGDAGWLSMEQVAQGVSTLFSDLHRTEALIAAYRVCDARPADGALRRAQFPRLLQLLRYLRALPANPRLLFSLSPVSVCQRGGCQPPCCCTDARDPLLPRAADVPVLVAGTSTTTRRRWTPPLAPCSAPHTERRASPPTSRRRWIGRDVSRC